MARVLVTGMSGAGKSTILAELGRRGRFTVDTDHDGWTRADGTWDESRMTALLRSTSDLVVSGTVENQGRFYDRFAHVVLVSAPLPVLLERVRDRTNPYGSTAAQRAEIVHHVETVEPLLRRGATVELDGCRSPAELADAVEALLASVSAPRRIRLSRRRGWRKPAGAVVVARPGRWGNPHRVSPAQDRATAVQRFRDDLLAGRLPFAASDVREHLAGRDLACWCPLDGPCHADVLLELAQRAGDTPRGG